MFQPRFVSALCAAVLLAPAFSSAAENWPQFRGVNGSARSASAKKLPAEIGPDKNVVWKVPLPPGHCSPVIFGERIYLTAVRDEELWTIALDRSTGRQLWEVQTPHQKLEQIHRIGSHAQATCATDGERVVSFFGSCGLFCYDTSGKLRWRQAMGPFNNDFGAATSPLIVDDWVILCQDHDTDSFLMAIDKRTGETVWKIDRSEFPRNYCTPVIAEVNGKKQIIVAATLRIVGYDFQTGHELWTVRGIARAACSSPAIGEDGTVYFASFAGGSEPGDRIQIAPFDGVIKGLDLNQNGTLEKNELEEGSPLISRFSQVDRDKTGTITREEYEYFRGLFDQSRNVVLAIKPGGSGDVTSTHVNWEFTRFVPFIASPVVTGNSLFMLRDGGILTALDARSGKLLKTERLPITGAFYSSPVAGDGKLYLFNERGESAVVRAAGDWQLLSTAEFDEDIYATPAIVDGRLYVRTAGHLYCFGTSGS